MTTEELLIRLRQDEDGLVERKTTGHKTDVLKAVVAFANSVAPGTEAVLFIGQRPDKTVAGVENPETFQQSVAEWCAKECYPPIAVQCRVLPVDGRQVLAVVVGPSSERPHFTGRAYKRVGARTEEASGEMLDELIASRNDKASWLLRHKRETVTVDFERVPMRSPSLAQKLGRDYVLIQSEDCVIEGASAHSVELKILASGRWLSIALERVVITKDVKNFRPLRLRVKLEA